MADSKVKWDLNTAVSFAALSISLITLFIFIYQTNIISKQGHLSVMPYLNLEANLDDQFNYEFELYNYGVGPAIIEEIFVIYQGQKYEMDLASFAQEIFPQKDSIELTSYSSIDKGTAIAPGDYRTMFAVGGSENKLNRAIKVLEEINEEGFDFEIRYKSIYDDKWKLSFKNQMPEEM